MNLSRLGTFANRANGLDRHAQAEALDNILESSEARISFRRKCLVERLPADGRFPGEFGETALGESNKPNDVE